MPSPEPRTDVVVTLLSGTTFDLPSVVPVPLEADGAWGYEAEDGVVHCFPVASIEWVVMRPAEEHP